MKRVKFFIALLPAIIFFFVMPQNAYLATGESKTLDVTQDTYANQAYPDQNRGTIGSVIISNKYTTRLGYLQFEDVNLPEGAILDKATLNFYAHEVHYSSEAKVNIGPITSNWDETTVTWNNKPTINQVQAIEIAFTLTAAGWRELDITPLVRLWSEGTVENKGLFIYPYGFLYGGTETEYAFSLRSKESGTERANIVVKYHFEPSPSPSPSPEVEPTEEPEEEEVVGKEEPSPTPAESPSPSPEAKETGLILGTFTPGQALIAGLILLALIGAAGSFATYARRKPKKKGKEKAKEEKEPEKEEEE